MLANGVAGWPVPCGLVESVSLRNSMFRLQPVTFIKAIPPDRTDPPGVHPPGLSFGTVDRRGRSRGRSDPGSRPRDCSRAGSGRWPASRRSRRGTVRRILQLPRAPYPRVCAGRRPPWGAGDMTRLPGYPGPFQEVMMDTDSTRAREFRAVFERDGDGVLVCTVPELRGCATQGRTYDEAVRNVREAIGLYREGPVRLVVDLGGFRPIQDELKNEE